MFKGLRVNLYSFACSDSGIPSWFQTSDVVCLLTSIGRVACGSIEEVGRGAQGCHARVSVAIHAIGDRAVATLLRGGAGDITVRGHTACTPTETYGRGKRGRYGERIGVRGVAEGRKKNPKVLHAMLPNALFLTWLMDTAIKAKRNLRRILDSIWQSGESHEQSGGRMI